MDMTDSAVLASRRNSGGEFSLLKPGRILTYIVLVLLALAFAFPFYYVFVLASWPNDNIFVWPPHLLPGPAFVDNYHALFEQVDFYRNLFNSAAIATLATVTIIFFCTMGGAAFALYELKGKKTLFSLMLLTYMIPGSLSIVPFFKIINVLGWYNTWLPMIIPGMANAFGIFLMTQYIKPAVPIDLMDAARIDGMSEFGILLKIIFPLAKSGISVLGILTFIGSWNTFLFAYIMLPDEKLTTFPVVLAKLFSKTSGGYGALMVGNAIALIPLIIVLLFFSKQIIAGITEGSLKG
ncbi:carbohydrate ABC transporter permease [Spirochaetia bacterium 38H-sp]|uniref:Carbohydrate ABC transporter permease n=1 Tax=Rarispira pelagica TaxID=3141764 RepID=A0ABU9UAR1_9SPIR